VSLSQQSDVVKLITNHAEASRGKTGLSAKSKSSDTTKRPQGRLEMFLGALIGAAAGRIALGAF
jgi:hypothetical protein